ncbi:MAG: TIGR03792 family protein [Synechococcus sp.]
MTSSAAERSNFTAPAATNGTVVEHLRIKVPAEARRVWHDAEQGSWEPWLAQQDGFLGRELLWDPETEEGILLIRWASRQQWKAIPAAEVAQVQEHFEQRAREGMGLNDGNPFPLVFEGELLPQ